MTTFQILYIVFFATFVICIGGGYLFLAWVNFKHACLNGVALPQKESSGYPAIFCVLLFITCVALVSDLESGFGTFRHAVAMIVPLTIFIAGALFAAGYCALAYVLFMDGRRRKQMTKEDFDREYLRRVSGVDKLGKVS